MENENIKTNEPRSGWLFTTRDKAYHSYMYYGVGIGEYARSHNLSRSTFHGWIERYPKGLPFYNADDPTQVAHDTPEGEVQMVKLSPSQLEKPQVQVMQKTEYHEPVSIDFYGARINADSHNIVAVLSAIKSVSDLIH